MAPSLSDLDVFVIDCQATAAAPRGHLLEIGWTSTRSSTLAPCTHLVALPSEQRLSPAVARITGISREMLVGAVDAPIAWRELLAAASAFEHHPVPTAIHYASFEKPFLAALAEGPLPLDIVCIHDIARRLLCDLPRRSLRALAGYFGKAVGQLRRSADHVEATAFVWKELVRLLEAEGVSTWPALHDWLATPAPAARRRHRRWPMPRDLRLSLPDAPGVYRMLRTNGDVLYVGKASSLRARVNSHFRHQHGFRERTLEMLSQARDISFEVAPSTLEAAILETDEIKRHLPPYNIALTPAGRAVWFGRRDLTGRSPSPSPRRPSGPFASAETLDQFAALVRRDRSALGRGRWAPEPVVFDAGYLQFSAVHHELSRGDLDAAARLLRLGTRLWREGRRDRDGEPDDESSDERASTVWTPETIRVALEWLVLRAALARRRGKWLTRLAESAIVWGEPGHSEGRVIVLENGEITLRGTANLCAMPPVPPGWGRPAIDRHREFNIASFDRLRVLTTELKRLTTVGAPLTVRFGPRGLLSGRRLALALSWV